ncbi:MAG: hypothetical protein BGO70_04485 [Bacteroidetes bacterium 43-93]|nr:hypothetical protein [Bacteroidota bacterium]OJX00028.1 MAG: hypothetical protein BGO70_04485 [Bacteroidetes bacterium 43-93]
MRFAKTILFAALVLTAGATYAQGNDSKKKDDSDELMNMLNQQDAGKKEKTYTTATFKTTRIINGASIENVARGVLDFKISHRFGAFNTGFNGFFGLDNANTSLGFDYGINDRIMVGISRGTYEKEYEGYTKIKLLRQTEGGSMPISLSYLGAISIQSLPAPTLPAGQDYHFSNRMYYVNQLLIAKKISQALSLQLTPTHIHYNLVSTTAEPNDLFAVGIGGRLKLTNRISLNAEYYYRINKLGNSSITYYNSLSLGFDIETGGHVFQLLFTNAPGITERVFIGQTSVSWPDGLRFGFNISRVFTIVKPKEFEGSRNKIW